MGIMKLELTGQAVEVEFRTSSGMYFVVYPEVHCPVQELVGFELVMAFDQLPTAWEMAIHTRRGTPFFTMIPVVPRNTAYPRPWLTYPEGGDYNPAFNIIKD